MGMINKLDRRIQVLRAELIDDGYQTRPGPFEPLGTPIPGSRRDVADAERFAAGTIMATLTSRFIVRHTTFSAQIKPSDRLSVDGSEWGIVGIKQIPHPRRFWLEITATQVVADD